MEFWINAIILSFLFEYVELAVLGWTSFVCLRLLQSENKSVF